MKKSSAMDRLLEEGFFDSREAALPYLMSGAVYCGAQPVSNGGQLVPLDKPMTVRGLYDRYVGKGGYKLEGAIRDFGIAYVSTQEPAPADSPIAWSSTARRWFTRWRQALVSWPGLFPRTRGWSIWSAPTWAMKSCFRSILFLRWAVWI